MVMWNIVLDDALCPVCREWQWRGFSIRVPFLARAVGGTPPRNQADAEEKISHLAYADDHLLAANSAFEVQEIMSMLRSSIASKAAVAPGCGCSARIP